MGAKAGPVITGFKYFSLFNCALDAENHNASQHVSPVRRLLQQIHDIRISSRSMLMMSRRSSEETPYSIGFACARYVPRSCSAGEDFRQPHDCDANQVMILELTFDCVEAWRDRRFVCFSCEVIASKRRNVHSAQLKLAGVQ